MTNTAAGGNGLVDALLGMWAQNPNTIPIQLPQVAQDHVPTNGVKPVATISSLDEKPPAHNTIQLNIKRKEPRE